MKNLVIIKEQRPLAYYAKFSKLFLFPENPLPPHKGDRGGLERRKALAALVLFVGRRYYLRPIIRRSDLWNARSATGTALGQWNARRAMEQSLWLPLERPQGS